MRNLKIFLAFRDKSSFFDPAKKKGNVGIPVIMVGNGEAFYDADPEMDLNLLR